MRAALLQLTSSDDPKSNLAVTSELVRKAASDGAGFILTPEVTNCISNSRTHQNEVLQHETDDLTLHGLREEASRLGVWLLIGSLALKADAPETRFYNRSFLIGPDGSNRRAIRQDTHVRCAGDPNRDVQRIGWLCAGRHSGHCKHAVWNDRDERLLRYTLRLPLPYACAVRGTDPHRARCVLASDRSDALGTPVTRPCD